MVAFIVLSVLHFFEGGLFLMDPPECLDCGVAFLNLSVANCPAVSVNSAIYPV